MTRRKDSFSVRSLTGEFPRSGRKHRGNNPAIGQHAKKLLAAGVAAIGGKAQEALQEDQSALLHSVARDVFQVEIPATRAVNVMHEGERYRPGIKPQIARLASPWPQLNQRGEEVGDAAATGTQAIRTPASGADHFAGWNPIMARQHIQNELPEQESRKRGTPRTV